MNLYPYFITPFFAWLCAGSLKFLVNSIKAKKLAFKLIGYGGMPSNHSTIVTSMAALIAFKEGVNTPTFGVAVTLAFIVMMDANGLRRTIEKHAKAINQLNTTSQTLPLLRERVGHSKAEIFAGIIVGIIVGFICSFI